MTGWLASLKRHKGLKLLSLSLAVALWLAVGGEERTETTLNMPLEFVGLATDKMITSTVPPNLQVRVVGPRSVIRNLPQRRLVHTLDLAGLKAGNHSFPLGPQSFDLPRGVEVSRVQPNPIALTLVNTTTRILPIKPMLSGSPPEGYEVKSVTIRPDHVKVKGPAEELEALKAVTTLPIDLANLSGPATLATDLNFQGLNLTLKDQVPILADINIGPKIIDRKIGGVPVTADKPGVRLSPAKISVTVQGPWPQVKALKPEDLKATVDTENVKPGRHRLEVSVQLPDGLHLLRPQPATITAVIPKN